MTPLDFTRQVQSDLIARGYNLGRWGADGDPGSLTQAAWRDLLRDAAAGRVIKPIGTRGWPMPDERSVIQFYGSPGSANLVTIDLPYPMRLSWEPRTTVSRTQCHRLVADSLRECLAAILEHYGSLEHVQAARMDLFGGCYNYRQQRGGSSWSLHAFGAAIDIDPVENGLGTPWPQKATMPVPVIEIFEARGWKSGARAWGRDAMHFQATR